MATLGDRSSKNSGRVWHVPDVLSAEGMHGVMAGLNTIVVFPHKPIKADGQEPHCETTGNVNLHCVESYSWLWGRHARKLVNEALGTFLSLQAAVQDEGPTNCKPTLVKKCRGYRSMIQACIEEMNNELESCGDILSENMKNDLNTNCQLLYKMELVLSLVEILFIDTKPGGCVLNQLVGWIRLHFPGAMTKLEAARAHDHPHQHPHYWEAAYGLVLQGQMDEVRQLLQLHPSANSDSFLSMDELLRKMPTYQPYGGVTESEFNVRWQHWQLECERRLQEQHFSTSHQLTNICQILCGEEQTLLSHLDLMDTWYHLMVSTLLFRNPTVRLFRLHAAAQDALMAVGGLAHTTTLDQMLLAAMEADAHQVIKHSQQVMDHAWFGAHLTDLLYHTLGHKSEHKFLGDLRESLLLDYAEVLVGHPSLWQVGILYLDHCGPQGVAMQEVVLERLPLTDDSKAQKVIQMSEDREMDHVVVSLCRVMGRKALAQSRLGAAVWWGVRSRDAAFTSHLAHQILHKYIAEGKFESSALLDNLGPAMLLSDTLTFLGKYREFHTLYTEGNYQEAAHLLISLISSRLAPEYFWPILLVDSLPLLKADEPVISTEQTYELMYCLHNLCDNTKNRNKSSPLESETAQAAFSAKESEIRLALTNNLARAVIHEGSVAM